MRKRITGPNPSQSGGGSGAGWLDVTRIATVEVTSEDPCCPIESVFGGGDGPGWRASHAGKQHIRLIFDQPIALQRVQLCFREAVFERTQEFTLRWWSGTEGPGTELVRQQWNFSPAGATTETENYTFNLTIVSVLELAIQPDISLRDAFATLTLWRVG